MRSPNACSLFFLIATALPFARVQLAHAQQVSPPCTPSDLFLTPAFAVGPGNRFTIAFDVRNTSSHTCILSQPNNPPSFVPDRLEGHPPIRYNLPSQPPNPLHPDETAHLTYYWATSAPTPSDPCVPLQWIAGPVLLVTPTLLQPVCSAIEGGLYEAGPFRPESSAAVQSLTLSAAKATFDLGEQFFLQLSDPSNQHASSSPCPKLFLLERAPDGTTRFDETTAAGFVGCQPWWPGRQKGDWTTGFPVSSGANSHWEGVGTHQFQVFDQLQPSHPTASPAFRRSRVLALPITDPKILPRTWPPPVKGVAVNITLDQSTYLLGQDIPLHLAVENISASVPVRAWDPSWDPSFAIGVRVLDSHNRSLPEADRLPVISSFNNHGFGPHKDFPLGAIYPIERSLLDEGWLPTHPGNYTVVVTWAPFLGQDTECTTAEARVDIHISAAPFHPEPRTKPLKASLAH